MIELCNPKSVYACKKYIRRDKERGKNPLNKVFSPLSTVPWLSAYSIFFQVVNILNGVLVINPLGYHT